MMEKDFRATGLALAIMSALPDNAASSAAAAAASAAEAKAVQESIPEDYTTLSNDVDDLKSIVAYSDGSYDNLTAGNAEQLLSTTGVTDKVPYLFRPSAGDGADREQDKIVGGTVAWNQIAKELIESNYNKGGGTAVYDNGTVSFTAGSRFGALYCSTLIPLVNGHKYLINSDIKLTNVAVVSTVRVAIGHTGYNQGAVYVPSTSPVNTFINVSGVVQYNPGTDPTNNYLFLQDNRAEVSQIDIKNLMLFDLTLLFGSTIADYIYSLEQSNAGAGVAWFRKLFPRDYYDYNPGELISVVGLQSHDMVGFNAFDKSTMLVTGCYISNNSGNEITDLGAMCTDFIRVIGGMAYYIRHDATSGNWGAWYDSDKHYISEITGKGLKTAPVNATFMRFSIKNKESSTGDPNTLCINLSCERDGEYEPYVKHSYPLDSTITLRGIPKLDSNNELYYDGDVYQSDGTVTRKYQQRAYQSGDENLADAITDGTNTVIKLSPPTTEIADTFQSPQILDPNGTEAYIDTRDVPIPVGHETFYPENLRSKVEGLPKDFSTLIAPTEATYTATQPYASGALFIVNNIIYKATASIANGATITPGTNCTATTLAAVIKNEYITPEMYGAAGDGTTDDTTYVQNAVNAGNTNGLVVYFSKTYKITDSINIGSGKIINEGTINYTGSDYALILSPTSNIDGAFYNLGTITAENGGCLYLNAENAWIQYLNINFKKFRAKNTSSCIYAKIVGQKWINEVRIESGRFLTGLNAVYIDTTLKTGTYPVSHWTFDKVGLEGCTNGFNIPSNVTRTSFVNCRAEESITNVVYSQDNTNNTRNLISWSGSIGNGTYWANCPNYIVTFADGFILSNGVYVTYAPVIWHKNQLYGLGNGGGNRNVNDYSAITYNSETHVSEVDFAIVYDYSTADSKKIIRPYLRHYTWTTESGTTLLKVYLDDRMFLKTKSANDTYLLSYSLPPNCTIEIYDHKNGTKLYTKTNGASTVYPILQVWVADNIFYISELTITTKSV